MPVDPRSNIRPLSELTADEPAKVAQICLDAEQQRRIEQMGLHPGSVVSLMIDSTTSAVVVAVGSDRIALSHDVAEKIYVY